MTLVNYDDALNQATTNGRIEIYDFFKTSITAINSQGHYNTLWFQEGNPSAGVAPSAGSATVGAGGTARTSAAGSIQFANQSQLEKRLFGFEGQIHHTT